MRFKKIGHREILILIVVLFIISQALVITLIFEKRNEALLATQKTDEKIDLINKDLQNKINSLTETLSSLSSTQTILQKQLGEIKAETSADFSGIIETELKGVVNIKTDISQGSGFLITDDGYILTNYHVVEGARKAGIYTYDNKLHSTRLIGYDEVMDLALLKIEGSFSSLSLGNSDDIKVGEKVIAIGNPLGLSFTVTEGIISARDRKGINSLPYYFQTDVSLNPGNSGGPLIDKNGRVIGINNFKISGAEALGFALEINYAKEKINDITLRDLNQTII